MGGLVEVLQLHFLCTVAMVFRGPTVSRRQRVDLVLGTSFWSPILKRDHELQETLGDAAG